MDRELIIVLGVCLIFVVLGGMFQDTQSKKCEFKGGVYLIHEDKCVTGIKEIK